MFERISFVCAGNICRSPMAEALLSARLAKVPGIRVNSAGLSALVGHPADPTAVALLRERGIDLSRHRARQLTSHIVLESELVLVMERAHRRHVEAMFPAARGRVHLLGRTRDFEVPDPYRGSRAAFEEALWLIERGLDDLERVLRPKAVETRKTA